MPDGPGGGRGQLLSTQRLGVHLVNGEGAAEARIAIHRIADAEGMVYESDAAIEGAIQALLERRDAPRMRRDAEEGAGR